MTQLSQTIIDAISTGNINDITKWLNQPDQNINAVDDNGWTALHHLAKSEKDLTTTEEYRTTYTESPETIIYGTDLAAKDIAIARATQAVTLSEENKDELQHYATVITFCKAPKVAPPSQTSWLEATS